MTLKDACLKIGSGATPRGGKRVYQDEGVALVRSQNVYNVGFETEGLVFLSDEHAKQLAGVTVEPDDVLLNITGDSVGRCCLAPDPVLPARVNQHVAILRPRPDRLDARFLRYFLVSPEMQAHMLSLADSGGTRPALTKAMIEAFDVPAPPLAKQRAIANTLDAFDTRVESNLEVACTAESLAANLFRARCLPATASDLPAGWTRGFIGDVAQSVRELDDRRGAPDEPYFGLDSMPRGSTLLQRWGTRSEVTGETLRFEVGDILFGKLRPYFKKVGVAPVVGTCSTEILVLRPLEREYFGFVLGHISSQAFIDYCDAVSTGAKMPRSEWEVAGRYPVVIPSRDDAAAHTRSVQPLYTLITQLLRENASLRTVRDALLPRLISGELAAPGDLRASPSDVIAA